MGFIWIDPLNPPKISEFHGKNHKDVEKSLTHRGYGTQTDSDRRGSVAADVIGSAVEVDEPLMAAGMDRGTAGAWRG